MPGHIRIVNDPVELVPLLMTFNNPAFKKVYELLNKSWMTEEEIQAQVKEDCVPLCLQILKKGNLVEEQWRMPKPGAKPREGVPGNLQQVPGELPVQPRGSLRYPVHLALERREPPRSRGADRRGTGKRQQLHQRPLPEIRCQPGLHQGSCKTDHPYGCEGTGTGAA